MHLMELRVEDVMIPKAQMVSLKIDDSIDQILKTVSESSHSRFPVFDAQGRSIQGLLLAKDLLAHAKTLYQNFSIRDILRPPFHAPLSRRLNHLLNDFRRNHTHLAIALDEHGVCAGLITIEDVLEQIVGEIEDEHDSYDEPLVFDHGNHRVFSVKALIHLDEFNTSFNTNFEQGSFDTLGGLLSNYFGYLPKKGETIFIDGLTFTILRADSRKIYLVKVTDSREQTLSAIRGAVDSY
jgi:magnesium and cobalt transporter